VPVQRPCGAGRSWSRRTCGDGSRFPGCRMSAPNGLALSPELRLEAS
jgi:hypothetical protein